MITSLKSVLVRRIRLDQCSLPSGRNRRRSRNQELPVARTGGKPVLRHLFACRIPDSMIDPVRRGRGGDRTIPENQELFVYRCDFFS